MAKLNWHSASVVLGLALLGILVLGFQNCSGGFEVDTAKLESIRAASVFAEPSLAISNPPAALIAMNSVSMSLDTVIDPKLTIRSINCSLNSGAMAACQQPLAFANLVDGNYALNIEMTDSRGLTAKTSATWTIDATKPTTTFNLKPGALSGAVVDFQFTATDALSGVVKLECALDDEAFAECSSPVKKSALVAGDHKFKIQATDKAGNISLTNEVAWTVDLSAPVVNISSGPAAFVNSSSATFAFSATAKNSTISMYECDLDAGGFAACASPKAYAALTEKKHTFTVRATSALNGLQASLASTWTIDLTPPSAPSITTTVSKYSSTPNVSFMFASSDGAGSGVTSYSCTLDGAVSVCASPKAYTVAEGAHSFSVLAIDTAGNRSTASTFTWTTDVTAPLVPSITSGPNQYVTDTSATFSFATNDGVGSGVAFYECMLDSGAVAACTSPKTYTVTEGAHVFKVRATDLAGNTSNFSPYNWTVDKTAPTAPVITTSTTPYTQITPSTFTYTSTDAGSGVASFDCAQDAGAFQICGTLYQIYGADGRHTFSVRARDVVGNVSLVSSFTWVVDTQPPQLTFTQVPAKVETSGTSTFKFTTTDQSGSILKATCWWTNSDGDQSAPTDCSTGTVNFTNLNFANYSISIQVKDEAGNLNDNGYEWEVAEIVPLTGQAPVSIGVLSACASVGGAAKCWGNYTNSPGTPDMVGFSRSPYVVPGFETGVTGVAVSEDNQQYCSIQNGRVRCAYFGNPNYLLAPVNVSGLDSAVTAIASGSYNGGFASMNGQLKRFYRNPDFSYTVTLNYIPDTDKGVQTVAGYGQSLCVIQNGAVHCSLGGGNPTRVPKLHGTAGIAVWANGACAMMKGGVWCWGDNSSGGLGNPGHGLNFGTSVPELVPGMQTGVTSVSASRQTVCAVKSGDAFCWGVEQTGQMVGDSNAVNSISRTPKLVAGLAAGSVKAVSVGESNTCFVMNDSTLKCLGYGNFGALGNGSQTSTSTPVTVNGIAGLVVP